MTTQRQLSDPAILDEEVVALLRRCVLVWLATADGSGAPNVSPKELFLVRLPDRVLIADIASPATVRNIRTNPEVCVAAVDVFDQRGVQLHGTARVVDGDDPSCDDLADSLRALAGPDLTVRHVMDITVSRKRPIVAPSYWARPGQSPEDRRAAAFAAYGVRPFSGPAADPAAQTTLPPDLADPDVMTDAWS